MMAENILDAMGEINDEAIQDAREYRGNRSGRAVRWGAMAACFVLVVTAAAAALPGLWSRPGGVGSPPDPGPVVIDWDNVVVNESAGFVSDTTRIYRDPDLYEEEIWGQKEIKDYYGRELNVPYIPDGLTEREGPVTAVVYRDKATGEVMEDQVSRGFWVDFWEDGSPKSKDGIVIPEGFTMTVSKLGILPCGLLPVDEERSTDFGGVPVMLCHCSLPYGPFDPTQKAPDGLSNMPAGYYDFYTASFTLDGVEYEIAAQRLELEGVVQIVASIIHG